MKSALFLVGMDFPGRAKLLGLAEKYFSGGLMLKEVEVINPGVVK